MTCQAAGMLGLQLPAGQHGSGNHLKGRAMIRGAQLDFPKREGSWQTSELWETKSERLLRGIKKNEAERTTSVTKEWAKVRRETTQSEA